MGDNQFEQNFENKRLDEIISIAKGQLSSLKMSNKEKKESITFSKKEIPEDSSHYIGNLWSMENFHELVELSQLTASVADKISEAEMEARKIVVLERMINSPYFARIDFKFDDEDEFEKIYIGLSSLIDDKSHEIYIYDWRSPISSVFYRFGTGKVFYDAPSGKITGEVSLKRQYEIKNGKLEYFFDADIQILDEFLRKLLSQNASSKMKTIVETIQKDQDIIIRNMDMDLIMVQGAAGSGKTSVALHRAAYLMYQGLSNRLYSDNIVIISPNTLFEQYISNVLPDLGEKNINSLKFEDIIQTVVCSENIQTRNQLLEDLLSSENEEYYNVRKSSMEFKGSAQFIEILNRFTDNLPDRQIEFKDVYYDNKHLVNRQFMKNRVLKEKNILLGLRLKKLEQFILDNVHVQRKSRLNKLENFVLLTGRHSFEEKEAARKLSIYESTALIKEIRKFTELNIPALYRMLFNDKKYFYELANGTELPDCIDDILDFTCKNLENECLQYDDALALILLYLKLNGCSEYKDIMQVVIDEAQDYCPVHFEILNALFPKSRFTVLGDINQTIGKQEDLSLYDQFGKILSRQRSMLITMDKSFRCTTQILEYSTRFLPGGSEIKSFSRNGDVPQAYASDSLNALDDSIINEIMNCRKMNYKSAALICKTEKDAVSLYERLKDKINIQLIESEGRANLEGTLIMPIYLSKGLEFDAVLICDADSKHYNTEDDKKLLYIASTRALHRLNLFYTGEISPLL